MKPNGLVKIVGNICQDPQLLELPSGKKCQVFELAFHQNKESLFIPIYLYKICERLKKGDFISVDGSPLIVKRKDYNKLGLIVRSFILLKAKNL